MSLKKLGTLVTEAMKDFLGTFRPTAFYNHRIDMIDVIIRDESFTEDIPTNDGISVLFTTHVPQRTVGMRIYGAKSFCEKRRLILPSQRISLFALLAAAEKGGNCKANEFRIRTIIRPAFTKDQFIELVSD